MCAFIAYMLGFKLSKAGRLRFSVHCIYLCRSIMAHFNAQISRLFNLLIRSNCVGYPVKFKWARPLGTHVMVFFSRYVLYVSLVGS